MEGKPTDTRTLAQRSALRILINQLSSVPGSATKLYTAFYYDIKGQNVKTVRKNLTGAYEVTTTGYTFTGNPASSLFTYLVNGATVHKSLSTFTYDGRDRLTQVEHRLNDRPAVTLIVNTYDEQGRLKTTQNHGLAATKLTYAYNIRNWLTAITGTGFTQNLYYHTGNGTPKYNGSISSMTWKAGNETTTRGYKFTYDGLDRLLTATYGEGSAISTNANRFTENVTDVISKFKSTKFW